MCEALGLLLWLNFKERVESLTSWFSRQLPDALIIYLSVRGCEIGLKSVLRITLLVKKIMYKNLLFDRMLKLTMTDPHARGQSLDPSETYSLSGFYVG